jgi:hypothetical protein
MGLVELVHVTSMYCIVPVYFTVLVIYFTVLPEYQPMNGMVHGKE